MNVINKIIFLGWILLGLLFVFTLTNAILAESIGWQQMSVRNQFGFLFGIFFGTFLSLMFIFIVFYLIYNIFCNS